MDDQTPGDQTPGDQPPVETREEEVHEQVTNHLLEEEANQDTETDEVFEDYEELTELDDSEDYETDGDDDEDFETEEDEDEDSEAEEDDDEDSEAEEDQESNEENQVERDRNGVTESSRISVDGGVMPCDPDVWIRSEVEGLLCPICMDAWTEGGDHQISCLPCGHVYGWSCIKQWLQRSSSSRKCPQCNRKCNVHNVTKIFAPRVAVVDEESHKRIQYLEAKCWSLERKNLELRKLEAGFNERLDLLEKRHTEMDRTFSFLEARIKCMEGHNSDKGQQQKKADDSTPLVVHRPRFTPQLLQTGLGTYIDISFNLIGSRVSSTGVSCGLDNHHLRNPHSALINKMEGEQQLTNRVNCNGIGWLFCPICVDALTDAGDHQICCLPCGHMYGFSCLKKWLQGPGNPQKCPLCNMKCSMGNVTKIFPSWNAVADEESHKRIQALEAECTSLRKKILELHKTEGDLITRQDELESKVNQLTKRGTEPSSYVRSCFSVLKSKMRRMKEFCSSQPCVSQLPLERRSNHSERPVNYVFQRHQPSDMLVNIFDFNSFIRCDFVALYMLIIFLYYSFTL